MAEERVVLWVHGHTHDAHDYVLNDTRIVCNPRGYFGYERSEDYKSDLVIEI